MESRAWDLVKAPQEEPIVRNRWVFKRKVDSAENVCYRARLVAKGFNQQKGVDFEETFSPVTIFYDYCLLFL